MLVAFICAALGATAPLEPGSAEELHVWLDGHRGALDVSGDAPVLRFQALAHSRLPVRVEAVEVGVLFAKDGDALVEAEPGAHYDGPRPAGAREVGAVRVWVETDLSPGGEREVLVESALSPDDPEPVAWLTHVLGYRLADFDVALLRELVKTDVFADEVAVVRTLGLAGDDERKRQVRERWGGRVELVQAFVDLATSPVPADPGLEVAIERVMAIRALGVLGGDRARAALTALMKDPGQAPLREPLMVMSIARLRGSLLEAPMAHALPPEARRISDVVAVALDDIDGWAAPAPVPAPAAEEENPDQPESVARGDDARPLWVVAFVAVVLVVGLLAAVALRLRRRD